MAQDDSILPLSAGLAPVGVADAEPASQPTASAPDAPPSVRRDRPAEAPPGRRRKPRPRLARSIFGLLHKIIDAAKRLSPRDFGRVLAGVLLIVAMVVVLPVIDTVEPLGIVLYAVICASLIIVLVKEEAVKKALIIMGIAAVGIMVAAAAPSVTRFLDTYINAQPVQGPVQRRAVAGTVVDAAGRPLAGVYVRTLGDATFVRTDATGRFGLSILESSIRNNTVDFYLARAEQGDTVSQVLDDGHVTLVFGGRTAQLPAPPDAAQRQNALRALPRAVAAPHGAAAAVIVDSIYTEFDGSWVGSASWSFDVSVPEGTTIHIRRTSYNDRSERRQRITFVGSETDAPLNSDTLTVTVRGMRNVLPVLRYRLKGSLALHADEIPADGPLRREIVVQDGSKWNNGKFRFYITILKLPARLEPS